MPQKSDNGKTVLLEDFFLREGISLDLDFVLWLKENPAPERLKSCL
jgi:hypothetical protein